jgi:hypothetical protein
VSSARQPAKALTSTTTRAMLDGNTPLPGQRPR